MGDGEDVAKAPATKKPTGYEILGEENRRLKEELKKLKQEKAQTDVEADRLRKIKEEEDAVLPSLLQT